jgi:hypothetical protein
MTTILDIRSTDETQPEEIDAIKFDDSDDFILLTRTSDGQEFFALGWTHYRTGKPEVWKMLCAVKDTEALILALRTAKEYLKEGQFNATE